MAFLSFLPILGPLIDKLVPDVNAAAAAKLELAKMEANGELQQVMAQLDINKTEAASSSLFVAGGRPFVIWVCGFGLAYAAILDPFLRFVAQVIFHYTGGFPAVDTSITLQVLFCLLGIGGYRTYEKVKGVATKDIGS